jgi:hypothetical protein
MFRRVSAVSSLDLLMNSLLQDTWNASRPRILVGSTNIAERSLAAPSSLDVFDF